MAKALYRTHRSKSFDEVIGQEHITETLKSAINKGAIAHAYLFTGPRGVGKTSVARILAHVVNDLPYTDESTHLDIIEIDAASNRRIDEIRDLRDKVHIAPTSARYKVYIIDEVHMLTREAFNALLKTLEEPPEHALFILATTEAHKVPDTIISRTQRFHFKPIEPEAATEHLSQIALKEGIHITDKGLTLLAHHGRGSFRDSISLLDQLAGLNKDTIDEQDINFLLGVPGQELIDGILKSLQINDTDQLFEHIKIARSQGTDPYQLTKSISQTIRDQIVSGAPILGAERSLATCKSLLATNASSDYMSLELALLDNIVFGQKSVEPPKQIEEHTPLESVTDRNIVSKSVQKTEVNTTVDPEPIEERTTEDPVISSQSATTQGAWPELLADIKGHHNTLYGILRMAKAEVTDTEAILTFQFAFHKQQVESPQHKKVLSEYVARHFGPLKVTTLVSKDKRPSSQETVSTNISDPISTLSDIFGAAELL